MNFSETEQEIESVKQSAKDLVISDDEQFEGAKKFSQSISTLNIWLDKLKSALNESNKIVTKKCDEYDRKPKPKKPVAPETRDTPVAEERESSPVIPSTPAPKPAFSLDDFDEAEPSEEDLLTAEMQKTLF